MGPQTFLIALALSVLLAALLVAARFVWVLVVALRARRYPIVVVSVVGVVCIVALFSAVIVVWFAYAVAHAEKNTSTDLTVLLSTAPPFFLASLGLWLLAGKLYSRLRPRVAQQGAAADTAQRRS
jgi:thiol:disulfide interchange protein